MPVAADKSICAKPEKPLYAAIAEHLESQVASGSLTNDERLPSTAELAKAYGTTISTLQQALSKLVERGLLRRSPKTGTFVDATRYGRRAMITFSFNPADMESHFYSPFLKGIEKEFLKRGIEWDCHFELSAGGFTHSMKRLASTLESGRYSFILSVVYSQELLKWLERQSYAPVYTCAYFNARKSVSDGLEYLARQGFKRIAFMHMGGDYDDGTFLLEKEGLCDAAKRGISVEVLNWGRLLDEAYISAKDFFTKTPKSEWPDAIFIHHDIVTKGALIAMTELDIKIPSDISLLTHANKGDRFQYPKELARMELDPLSVASAVVSYIDETLMTHSGHGRLISPPSAETTLKEGASVLALSGRELIGDVK